MPPKGSIESLATAAVSITRQVKDQRLKAFVIISCFAVSVIGPAIGTASIGYFVKDVPRAIEKLGKIEERVIRIEERTDRIEQFLHSKGYIKHTTNETANIAYE